MTELTSTMTVREIAEQAAGVIRALNELTASDGELANPADVRDVIAGLELMGQGMPQLCEQLARFLVSGHEDGQVTHRSGEDPAFSIAEVIEALSAAGQAADMMTAALHESLTAASDLC